MPQRLLNRVISAAFLLLLILPVAAWVNGIKPQITEAENRPAAVFPKTGTHKAAIKQFPAGFNAWFDDHLGLRQPLVTAHHALNHDLLASHDTVLKGRKDWLFLLREPRRSGAVLPIVPTTPFLLLAASCFLRTSPRLHAKLLANPTFGPYIEQWQHDHTVPRHAKRRGYLLIVISFAISISWIEPVGVKIGVGLFGLLLLACLAWVPPTPRGREVDRLR